MHTEALELIGSSDFYFVVSPTHTPIIAIVILENIISLILTFKKFHYIAQDGLKLKILLCQASLMQGLQADPQPHMSYIFLLMELKPLNSLFIRFPQ